MQFRLVLVKLRSVTASISAVQFVPAAPAAKRGRERPKTLVVYRRVSTASQVDRGLSPKVPRDAIRIFADRLGVPLLDILEDVASGRGVKNFPSRHGLQRSLEAVREHDAIFVVRDWSRLSRHASDLSDSTALLPTDDRIVSVRGGDTLADTPKAGRLLHAQRSGGEISK